MPQEQQDPYGHHLAMQKQREEWEQQRKAAAEQKRREALQEELASYLRHRSRDWADLTGSAPTAEDLRRWQQEFADARESKREAAREMKLAQAENQEHYPWSPQA